MGFENLAIFASSSGNPLSALVSVTTSLTLEFLEDPKTTKMYSEMSRDPAYFSKEAMTYNWHHLGISLDTFTSDAGLGKMFTPTATSTDPESGDTFVASMESPDYPFFGTQFHPEKVLTLYNNDALDHSWTSVHYNRYFADRFMMLARQNTNSCGEFEDCQALMIDNVPVIVTDTYYGNVYAW